MGVEKSKAVPKALWLALIFLGMMTAYDDHRRQRPTRADAEGAGMNIRAARLTERQAVNDGLLDRPEATQRR